ncbi:MAG: hypothetical protein ACYDER_01405 [Ktedonobacteraceae bacterium]
MEALAIFLAPFGLILVVMIIYVMIGVTKSEIETRKRGEEQIRRIGSLAQKPINSAEVIVYEGYKKLAEAVAEEGRRDRRIDHVDVDRVTYEVRRTDVEGYDYYAREEKWRTTFYYKPEYVE